MQWQENKADTKATPFSFSQEVHLATVVEILQSTKQSDMSPMLNRIYKSPGGVETLDVLMKYLYVLTVRKDMPCEDNPCILNALCCSRAD